MQSGRQSGTIAWETSSAVGSVIGSMPGKAAAYMRVRVGPGAHTIEMTYEPLSFKAGWIASLIALAGLAAALAAGLRARRRPATGP